MNEERIQKMLENKIRSMNDCTGAELKQITKAFYEKNKDVICKNLGFFTRRYKLEGKNLFCMNFGCRRNKSRKYEDVECRIKYGGEKLFIPLDFAVLLETLIQKDCKDVGLFRKPSNAIESQKCKDAFLEILEQDYTFDKMVDKLKRYDPLTISGSFQGLFSNFDSAIFPQNFLGAVLAAAFIEDPNEKFILTKYVLLKLPKRKRSVLEALAKFFEIMHEITTNSGVNYEGNLDLKGYGIIAMPSLFLKDNKGLGFSELSGLAEFTGYTFIQFRSLIDVSGIESAD